MFLSKATFFKIWIHFFSLAVKQRYPSNSLNNGPTDIRLRRWTRPFFDVGNFFDLLFGLGENFPSDPFPSDPLRIWNTSLSLKSLENLDPNPQRSRLGREVHASSGCSTKQLHTPHVWRRNFCSRRSWVARPGALERARCLLQLVFQLPNPRTGPYCTWLRWPWWLTVPPTEYSYPRESGRWIGILRAMHKSLSGIRISDNEIGLFSLWHCTGAEVPKH